MATFAPRFRYDPRRRPRWQREPFLDRNNVRMTERPWAGGFIRRPAKATPTVQLDAKRLLSIMDSLAHYDSRIGGPVQRELASNFFTNPQNAKAVVTHEKNVAEERLPTAEAVPSSPNTTIDIVSDSVCRGSTLNDVTNRKDDIVVDHNSKKRQPPDEEPTSSESAQIASAIPDPVRREPSQKFAMGHVESKKKNLACNESATNEPFKNAFASFRARIRSTIIRSKPSLNVETSATKVQNDEEYKQNKENRQQVQKVLSPLVTKMDASKEGPTENTFGVLKEKHSLPCVKGNDNMKELASLSSRPKFVVDGEKPSNQSVGVNHWKLDFSKPPVVIQAKSVKREDRTLSAVENLQSKSAVLSETKEFLLTRPPPHPVVAERMKRKAQKSKIEKYIRQQGDKKYRSCLKLPPPPPIIRSWDRKPKQGSKSSN